MRKIELRWAVKETDQVPVLQYREFIDLHEGITYDVYLGEPAWSDWKDVPVVLIS